MQICLQKNGPCSATSATLVTVRVHAANSTAFESVERVFANTEQK